MHSVLSIDFMVPAAMIGPKLDDEIFPMLTA